MACVMHPLKSFPSIHPWTQGYMSNMPYIPVTTILFILKKSVRVEGLTERQENEIK